MQQWTLAALHSKIYVELQEVISALGNEEAVKYVAIAPINSRVVTECSDKIGKLPAAADVLCGVF